MVEPSSLVHVMRHGSIRLWHDDSTCNRHIARCTPARSRLSSVEPPLVASQAGSLASPASQSARYSAVYGQRHRLSLDVLWTPWHSLGQTLGVQLRRVRCLQPCDLSAMPAARDPNPEDVLCNPALAFIFFWFFLLVHRKLFRQPRFVYTGASAAGHRPSARWRSSASKHL